MILLVNLIPQVAAQGGGQEWVGCETGPIPSLKTEGNELASTAVIDFEIACLGQSPEIRCLCGSPNIRTDSRRTAQFEAFSAVPRS
jgi:hypothetical protein